MFVINILRLQPHPRKEITFASFPRKLFRVALRASYQEKMREQRGSSRALAEMKILLSKISNFKQIILPPGNYNVRKKVMTMLAYFVG